MRDQGRGAARVPLPRCRYRQRPSRVRREARGHSSEEKQRFESELAREFRRNGIELPGDKKSALLHLNDDILKLGQDFESNLARAVGRIEVSPRQLDGLPEAYKATHRPRANGKVEITTDYADYFPFITYAHDRRAPLELYVAFMNRGGDENVEILERLLRKRSEKANLLGYGTWADFATEPTMARNAATVRRFLTSVAEAVRGPARAELAELMHMYLRTNPKPSGRLPPTERYYLSERVRSAKFHVDPSALSNYFEVRSVLRGVFRVAKSMFGLEFKDVESATWHPDVASYEVVTATGEVLGRLYVDAYARPDKFTHVAMFPIRTSARLASTPRILPVAALVASFPKPGEKPALLAHEDVVAIFDEFGRVLHHLLTRSELATYAGTSTVRDFVEVPAQVFEELAWSRDVLDVFAEHVTTHQKIPRCPVCDDDCVAPLRTRARDRAAGVPRYPRPGAPLAPIRVRQHQRR